MESLTTQAVSLLVIVGLNFLIFLLIWTEYFEHRVRFLKFVAFAQTFTLLWHMFSVWLTFYTSTFFVQSLSQISFFLSVYYLLVTSVLDRLEEERNIHRVAAASVVLLLLIPLFSISLLQYLWALNFILLLSAPFVTAIFFQQTSKKLIAFIQFAITLMFLSSVGFFSQGYQITGGLLYVMMGVFQPILSVLFIISSVRLSRKEIAERERNYRVFFESMNEVFFRLDGQGNIKEISPSINQFGFSVEQLSGKKLTSFLTKVEAFSKRLNSNVANNTPFEYVGSFHAKEGLVDCEVICSEVSNEKGKQRQFAGSIRNTHERNLLEQQFIESQRMESLAVLAGGMAHDFNNLLQGIIGYTEILLETEELDADLKSRGLNTILTSATTAGTLCKQLLHFTGKGARSKDKLNLSEVIDEVLEIMSSRCPDEVKITKTLSDDLAFIQGDSSQISQMILNLVKNACEAVGERGVVDVSLSRFMLDEVTAKSLKLSGVVIPGDYFLLAIKDNGSGIAQELKTKIFDPFVSTKEGGQGLGLSAVAGIIKTHNGHIVFNSEQGVGTEFKVLLPLFNEMSLLESKAIEYQANSNKVILLVEDDSVVRDIASKVLEKSGNTVLQAQDGIQALNIFEQSSVPIDLLVSDVKMPNMDGITLFQKLKVLSPELPVILMSGYADSLEATSILESVNFQFLSKPFKAEELLSAVESATEKAE